MAGVKNSGSSSGQTPWNLKPPAKCGSAYYSRKLFVGNTHTVLKGQLKVGLLWALVGDMSLNPEADSGFPGPIDFTAGERKYFRVSELMFLLALFF